MEYLQQTVTCQDNQGLRPNIYYRTHFCKTFQENGECPYGSKCTYAHSQEQLRQVGDKFPEEYLYHFRRIQNRRTAGKFKTQMCKYACDSRNCPFGASCSFAHCQQELRSAQDPLPSQGSELPWHDVARNICNVQTRTVWNSSLSYQLPPIVQSYTNAGNSSGTHALFPQFQCFSNALQGKPALQGGVDHLNLLHSSSDAEIVSKQNGVKVSTKLDLSARKYSPRRSPGQEGNSKLKCSKGNKPSTCDSNNKHVASLSSPEKRLTPGSSDCEGNTKTEHCITKQIHTSRSEEHLKGPIDSPTQSSMPMMRSSSDGMVQQKCLDQEHKALSEVCYKQNKRQQNCPTNSQTRSQTCNEHGDEQRLCEANSAAAFKNGNDQQIIETSADTPDTQMCGIVNSFISNLDYARINEDQHVLSQNLSTLKVSPQTCERENTNMKVKPHFEPFVSALNFQQTNGCKDRLIRETLQVIQSSLNKGHYENGDFEAIIEFVCFYRTNYLLDFEETYQQEEEKQEADQQENACPAYCTHEPMMTEYYEEAENFIFDVPRVGRAWMANPEHNSFDILSLHWLNPFFGELFAPYSRVCCDRCDLEKLIKDILSIIEDSMESKKERVESLTLEFMGKSMWVRYNQSIDWTSRVRLNSNFLFFNSTKFYVNSKFCIKCWLCQGRADDSASPQFYRRLKTEV